jgi:polysaccharide deacetylase 2 family uncharacterized protein YibQ
LFFLFCIFYSLTLQHRFDKVKPMAYKRKRKRSFSWLPVILILLGLPLLTVLIARSGLLSMFRHISTTTSPVGPDQFIQGLEGLSAGEWLVRKDLVKCDSLVPKYTVTIPQAYPSVIANLRIHRLARQNGFEVLAALEDRRLRLVELTLGIDGLPALTLVVRKKALELTSDRKIPLVALAVYGAGSKGMVDLTVLKTYSQVRTLITGTALKNAQGWEIVNYLPLEPKGYPHPDPGPGTILVDDASMAVRDKLNRAYSLNPRPAGMCAYYGSRALEDGRIADELARFIAGKKIPFIEPLPTAHSLAGEACLKAGCVRLVPDAYLGKDDPQQLMAKALHNARATAEKRGQALALLPATSTALKALSEAFPKGSNSQYRFVAVSGLLKP